MSVSSTSLIEKIYAEFSGGVHFANPIPSSRTSELNLVNSVLHILQGCSSSLLYWDEKEQRFVAKVGLFVNHLSQRSLGVILNQFMYAATCLKLVENVISKVECSHNGRVVAAPPTLRAFCCSVSSWLKRLRDMALKEEERLNDSGVAVAAMPTLMGLANSLLSLCSGAEYLLQLVHGAIPKVFLDPGSPVSAAEISAFILDHLYKKLNDICLIQGGEEEPYLMVLYLFVGSLLPYIKVLDSWLYEGTLDDPFGEMFFYANESISIDEADFWEKSYLQRSMTYQKLNSEISAAASVTDPAVLTNGKKEMAGRQSVPVSSTTKGKEQTYKDPQVCPLFLKDIAHSIVSAGKSLQLIQHVHTLFQISYLRAKNHETDGTESPKKDRELKKTDSNLPIARLTLSEAFCVSLSGLIGHGDHISEYFCQNESCDSKIVFSFESHLTKQKLARGDDESLSAFTWSERIWFKFLVDMLLQKSSIESENKSKDVTVCHGTMEAGMTHCVVDESLFLRSFYSENPAITVCQSSLSKNKDAWNSLNLSKNFFLPPLNDQVLREAIFGGGYGTNYAMGFQFAESDYHRTREDSKLLEVLLPFPTILPSSKVDSRLSELLPFQNDSTLPSRVLDWIQTVEPKVNPLPGVIMQACLTVYIRKQVDCVGKQILMKLMNDWRLMDELGVLRAIYLLGSGDLLQHFLTVIFDRLDKGESWDDDFELNTILQESIRNSADGGLLSAPDSLVVSISRSSSNSVNNDDQIGAANLVSITRKARESRFGIDGLDLLNFTYKVPWPLELIANTEAIKKYNQVMRFLLKVKRAKYVLDKARRWMWKARGAATIHRKRHWLVEQKLLHFVDAFHQYVMDRVYHSAWLELCDGMVAAGSLDEVIEVHEAYLLSIQRQCFAVPDKLGALIASRINSILGLALDFHTVQQTLSSGGPVSAIKARCEMEVERIEKQFDDCIAFLLRVLSFKLNVGHFPHLADLVTRINYNFFYMSGSGNLITAPGSESVTSRIGKTFPVRGD